LADLSKVLEVDDILWVVVNTSEAISLKSPFFTPLPTVSDSLLPDISFKLWSMLAPWNYQAKVQKRTYFTGELL